MRLFSSRELKIFFSIILIVTTGAVLVTILVTSKKLPQTVQSEENIPDKKIIPEEVKLTDFIIPVEFQEIWKERWYPFRPRMDSWSWEMAKKYWIEPRLIGIDILSKENNRKLKELLENVP